MDIPITSKADALTCLCCVWVIPGAQWALVKLKSKDGTRLSDDPEFPVFFLNIL
jgi:hypothetical protein